MGFFEDVVNAVRGVVDVPVIQLVLGWHASAVVAEDGRWGIGCVPDSLKEAHMSRESHTNRLLGASLAGLAELVVSPFPQEFAAATAACAALLPFPSGGFRLDTVMPCARGDKVAVLGYERELIPLMRDWGWKIAVFDDIRQGPDCFPQKDFSDGARGAEWVWLSPEAVRDRWLISTAEVLKEKKGCFLQGPGLPWLRESFAALGVTHLVSPRAVGDAGTIRARIAAGGDPWLCPELEWRVHYVAP
ncbi:MAG: hypothetical protein LBD04_00010 [Synergistaceae bacterium]|jgi:hypothetical protein|nr:hypothetical protein [Synergistaceae bacterium]